MKRRLMVLFLSLSAATVFAAGSKEKPPQKRRPKKKADTVIRTSRYGCGSGTVTVSEASGTVMVSVWIV